MFNFRAPTRAFVAVLGIVSLVAAGVTLQSQTAQAADNPDVAAALVAQNDAQVALQAAKASDPTPGIADKAAPHSLSRQVEASPQINTMAATLASGFDPAYIISDNNFYNGAALNEASIQAFLNAQVPTCRSGYTCLKDYHQDTATRYSDAMCNQYTGAANESAARIIFKVGQACGISQKVLIVLLQKEQSLVLDDWPGAGQFRSATGYACPDTAPCDADYYGFFNQVYKAAWQFKRYGNPPGTDDFFTWHPVGSPAPIQYSPNASCGSSLVTIRNEATAALYYYTPYQPNAAALANPYGIGDGCSSYGNRNFWQFYKDWFGSPTDSPPFGNVEATTLANGTLTVSGWAIDPTAASTSISVRIDITDATGGQGSRSVVANASRPDVGAAYPAAGNAHGFSLSISATASGQYTACITALSVSTNTAGDMNFGCRYAFYSSTIGGAPTVNRIAGADRFATAAAISQSRFKSAGVPVVYVATGANFADALAAAPAAAAQGGPLLLVNGSTVPSTTAAELNRLAPKKIVVVGGPSAIGEAAVSALKNVTPNVTRIAGLDRFETSRDIAVSAFGGAKSVFIATGNDFPDALSASAAAGARGVPVILVDGAAGQIDIDTKTFFTSRGISQATVVGGTNAVTTGFEAGIAATGAAVARLGGPDRFATSNAINRASFSSAPTVYLATGSDFPDALAGSAVAAAGKSPLYVVRSGCVPRYDGQELVRLATRNVIVFGGTSVLSPDVMNLAACT